MGRISKRLKRQLSQVITGQVSPGFDLYQVAQQAKDQTEPIEIPDHFRDFHPVHAVYLAAQNMVSFLAEQLSVLPELVEYYEMMVEAEDAYMPDGPPLSPLTRTYFTIWAFFDAPFGRDCETIGTCVLDLGPDLGLAWDSLEIIRLMQQSRMGIYENQGVRGNMSTFKNRQNLNPSASAVQTGCKHRTLIAASAHNFQKIAAGETNGQEKTITRPKKETEKATAKPTAKFEYR